MQSYFNDFNNYENINYRNDNIKILSTSKLASLPRLNRNSVKIETPLYYKDTMVYSDSKGNINIYSLGERKKIFIFNFYKKKFKKIKKSINLLIKDKRRLALGTFYHQLHHRYYECNYGNEEMPWDRWFGTFHDGSELATEKTRARKKAMQI